MKVETRSFYELAVRRAVLHIAAHIDDALDLGALSRLAALSPFHFHRVFRGMCGETPLEMHRRLRMERAAHRLIVTGTGVTQIAFEAGYDTHEAFTRAFRAAYGEAPSAFRKASSPGGVERAMPLKITLATRSGVHFTEQGLSEHWNALENGGPPMKVDIEELQAKRLATIRHVGPYPRISEAFARLGAIAGPAGIIGKPGTQMIAVYHDDPESVAPEDLRSDAGLTIADGTTLPAGLTELRLRAGSYACTTHVGPYTTLGDTWARLMGEWLPRSGHRVGEGESFEIYENNPMNARPEELRTRLCVPLG